MDSRAAIADVVPDGDLVLVMTQWRPEDTKAIGRLCTGKFDADTRSIEIRVASEHLKFASAGFRGILNAMARGCSELDHLGRTSLPLPEDDCYAMLLLLSCIFGIADDLPIPTLTQFENTAILMDKYLVDRAAKATLKLWWRSSYSMQNLSALKAADNNDDNDDNDDELYAWGLVAYTLDEQADVSRFVSHVVFECGSGSIQAGLVDSLRPFPSYLVDAMLDAHEAFSSAISAFLVRSLAMLEAADHCDSCCVGSDCDALLIGYLRRFQRVSHDFVPESELGDNDEGNDGTQVRGGYWTAKEIAAPAELANMLIRLCYHRHCHDHKRPWTGQERTCACDPADFPELPRGNCEKTRDKLCAAVDAIKKDAIAAVEAIVSQFNSVVTKGDAVEPIEMLRRDSGVGV